MTAASCRQDRQTVGTCGCLICPSNRYRIRRSVSVRQTFAIDFHRRLSVRRTFDNVSDTVCLSVKHSLAILPQCVCPKLSKHSKKVLRSEMAGRPITRPRALLHLHHSSMQIPTINPYPYHIIYHLTINTMSVCASA